MDGARVNMTSKKFARFDRASQNGGPLDACLTWVDAHAETDYLILSREEARVNAPGTYRTYEAMTVAHFLETYADAVILPSNRRYHEVIRPDRPCKVYLDVEFVPEANPTVNGRSLVTNLVAALQTRLQGEHNTSSHVLILDGSKTTKFSQHIIFNGPVFASPTDVYAFVAATAKTLGDAATVWDKDGQRRIPIYDPRVYNKNHTLRVYGSTYLAEPTRAFRLPSDPTTGPFNREAVEHSLITAVSPTATLLEATATDYTLLPATSRRNSTRPISPARADLVSHTSEHGVLAATAGKIARVIPVIQKAHPHWNRIRVDKTRLMAIVPCASKTCAIRGRDHTRNTTFYTIDLITGRYRQLCYSENCLGQYAKSPWQPFPNEAAALAKECATQEWHRSNTYAKQTFQKLFGLTNQ